MFIVVLCMMPGNRGKPLWPTSEEWTGKTLELYAP